MENELRGSQQQSLKAVDRVTYNTSGLLTIVWYSSFERRYRLSDDKNLWLIAFIDFVLRYLLGHTLMKVGFNISRQKPLSTELWYMCICENWKKRYLIPGRSHFEVVISYDQQLLYDYLATLALSLQMSRVSGASRELSGCPGSIYLPGYLTNEIHLNK